MGARLLRGWMIRPSIDAGGDRRPDTTAVAELSQSSVVADQIASSFEGIFDLERLLSRITIGTAGPARTRLAAKFDREAARGQRHSAEAEGRAFRSAAFSTGPSWRICTRCISRLSATIPRPSLADGGVIRDGYTQELDELRSLSKNNKGHLAMLESRERERTGINSLKVRFNNVFGYYIEISNANLHLVPKDYDRKQTLVNAERFSTA